MSQRSSFNWGALSRGSQLLLGGSVLFLIDMFLPWNRACVTAFGTHVCGSANGWHDFGLLAGLVAIAIIVLEVMGAMGQEVPKGAISLGLAAVLLVATILRLVVDSESLWLGAWVGLILALAVAYGGWLRYQEVPSTTGSGPATPPPAA